MENDRDLFRHLSDFAIRHPALVSHRLHLDARLHADRPAVDVAHGAARRRAIESVAIPCAGCRGLKVGNAQVSEMHCNFLINVGGANAADIETLGETVRERVKENSGVELEWEIKRIGVAT